jgi:small-conductance mechanosensitive channel
MLLAAERTPELRDNPKPAVLQTALLDAAVQYTLLVCLEQPERRVRILDKLHANIQDAFNEYGVQIMSPQYEADPNEPKVVPPSRWYAAPASPPTEPQKRASTEKSGRGSLGTV